MTEGNNNKKYTALLWISFDEFDIMIDEELNINMMKLISY